MKKYEEIYLYIVTKINEGEYKIGDSLPSENELSSIFNTSRVTVRRALNDLDNNGLIIKQQGKESIVVSNTLKSKTVLLILPNLFVYIFADLIAEIEKTLRENNIYLLIACSYNDQKKERDIIRNYLSVVDGIILEPTQAQYTKYIHSKTYASLTTKPTICINSRMENFNIPYLIVDDESAMKKLTLNLVERGLNRYLILAKNDDFQGYSRLKGTVEVLNNSDVKYQTVEFTTYNVNVQLAKFAKLYHQFKPDCIIFYNDEYANKVFTQYNINPVYDGVTVAGFDNTDYSNGNPYTFLSPNHPKEIMGRDAANGIIKLLNGEKFESVIYEPEIDFNK